MSVAMRYAAALILAVSQVVMPGGPASADSPLKRLTLRSDALGWEAVGRLDFGDSGYCSGVLIATDLVLTAGHCVYERAGRRARGLTEMRFRTGLRDGKAIAERGVRRAVVDRIYTDPATDRATQVVHDVALVQLAEPIPAAVAAPFLVGDPPAVGAAVSVVSYARGRSDALSWQRECHVTGRQMGIVAVSCNVDFGSSGAPVFSTGAGRARIVSIISSGASDGNTRIAFGMELAPRVAALKDALRTGRGVVEPRAASGSLRSGTNTGTGARFVRP